MATNGRRSAQILAAPRHVSVALVGVLMLGPAASEAAAQNPLPGTGGAPQPAAIATAPAVRAPQPPPPPVRCPQPAAGQPLKSTSGPGLRVALTFDDGPGPDTPHVLDALKASGARATFYVTGSNAQAHPELIRRIVAEGHELGNHTWDHPQLPAHGAQAQTRQLTQTNAAVHAITGRPLCTMRPPYGAHNAVTRKVARDLGLDVVMWTVDTEDWKARGVTPAETARIVRRANGGSALPLPIVLLHDGLGDGRAGGSSTARAVPAIVRHYRTLGYVFTDVHGRVL